ncbi:protein transport protein Sec16B isoform X3 [Alligator mississippiensis]|uniref:protein transport protein Sec16B isoform X3 n=1 Tax=Alligator mississippiensis TaxID=8496 RepID=UPI0006ECA524|nr:protein transport protein Sec16B isoform X3 [Alligator mississippiensis]
MEPWTPPWPPQPRERHVAPVKGQDRGQWRQVYHRPLPQSRPNGERYYHQQQGSQTGPQPWQDSWEEYYHYSYPWRPGDRIRPDSRAEYYESSYPPRPYSRQGHEDPHWNYPAPSSGEDYSYRDYYRHPPAVQDDRDPSQGDPYGRQADYLDQSYSRDFGHDQANSPFVQTDARQYRSKNFDSYEESYISSSRQEWTGEAPQRSSLEEASIQPHELSSTGEPSLLQRYKESGLSSSSYELSQYIFDSSNQYDPTPSEAWSPVHTEEASLATLHHVAPLKYSLPHVPVCFGAGGHLVRVCPNFPAEGQPALVELHSLEVILDNTKEQEELQAFPGPLVREDLHKVDVMTFCQHRVAMSCDLTTQRGRDSALLWKLLILLCRQNGSMVGSDTAELLMQDCKRLEKYRRQNPATNLINLTDDEWPSYGSGTRDLLTGEIPPSMDTPEQIVEKFTKLLYYGRKKEALDWAMRNQLWGHALFLSSKMDSRTYSWVLTGFTSTLAVNDPLQTLFQLMSGRIPQAALCCGDSKWGDWRPHLAVILSNHVGEAELNHRAIVTMGDTLAGKGLIEAAHFCYLMADVPFGHYGVKTDHMALLGSSHCQTFVQFATTESIQRTEIFEYCQLLGHPKSFIFTFQALYYCEGIGTALLDQPQTRHPVLLTQVIQLAERLKFSDPLLLERPDQEQDLEPDWLVQLRAQRQQWEVEGDFPDLTSTQPEFSRVNRSTSDKDLHYEFTQNQGYQHDLRQQLNNHSEGTSQYEPVLQEYVSLQSGMHSAVDGYEQAITSVLSGAGQESYPTVVSPRADVFLGGTASDHSPEVGQTPVGALEPQGHSLPFDVQKNITEEQQSMSRARIRTVSECSTVSVEDDAHQLPGQAGEGATKEQSSTEGAKQEETKGSGFGWFSWFRSKPDKDVASSRDQSETAPDSTALESQEQTLSSSPLCATPTAGTSPSSHAPASGSAPVFRSSASNEPTATTGPDGRKLAAFPEVGGQNDSYGPLSGPGGLLPPPGEGTVPLFNPGHIPQLFNAVSPGLSQPKRLSQRCYPTLP